MAKTDIRTKLHAPYAGNNVRKPRSLRWIMSCSILLCLTVLEACDRSGNGSGSASFLRVRNAIGMGGFSSGRMANSKASDNNRSTSVVYISGTSQSFSSVETSGFLEVRTLDRSSGALTPIAGSPFPLGYANGGDMVLSPNGASAYVLAEGVMDSEDSDTPPSFLLVYALDPKSGAPVLKQTLAAGDPNGPGPTNIAVHPSGRFVYLSNYYLGNSNNNGTGIFSVQGDGTLVYTGLGGPIQLQTSYGAVIHPSGRFLYTATDGSPAGELQSQPCAVFHTNVFAMRVNPGSGALTAVSGSPFILQQKVCEPGVAPQWLAPQIDSSGRRLFMIDKGNRTITVFAIDPSSGALTLLPGSTVDTENSGPAFDAAAIDPQGRFLYVRGPGLSFTGFSVSASVAAAVSADVPSGALPLLPGMPVRVTPSPEFSEARRSIAIDSSGTLLLGNEGDFTSDSSGPDTLMEFRIDPATGALTPVSSATVSLAGTVSKIVVAKPR